MVDIVKFFDIFQKSSLFDLFRLKVLLDKLLIDPVRLTDIKRQLQINQEISYFNVALNQEVVANVIKIARTNVLVRNINDGKIWELPLYMINTSEFRTDLRKEHHRADRLTLQVGDAVGFVSKDNRELYGVVVKLNPKTASIKVVQGGRWRVSYRLLFYVLDAEKATQGYLNCKTDLGMD